jgi:DNA-binding transcriptional LysR family regulator
MIAISPRQLEVFVQVVLLGSVRLAAEQLHMTQPAASMALAELERLLDAPLFARERGRLQLNARGRELLPLAQELIERHAEFAQFGKREGALLAGELRVGASNTVGNYRASELLGAFVQTHPQVSVRLSVSNTALIAAGVAEHRLDVGCVEGPVSHPSLDVQPWRDDQLIVCVPVNHPLSRKRRLAPTDFGGARWALREPGSAMRAMTERALAQLPAGHIAFELDQSEAIKQIVIAGLGISCLPAVAVSHEIAAGRLVALKTPFLDLQRKLSLLVHREKYRGALLEAFLASTRAESKPKH